MFTERNNTLYKYTERESRNTRLSLSVSTTAGVTVETREVRSESFVIFVGIKYFKNYDDAMMIDVSCVVLYLYFKNM